MRKHLGALGAGIPSYLANTNPLGRLPPLLPPKSHIQTHRAAPPRRRGPVRCEVKAVAFMPRMEEPREAGAGRSRMTLAPDRTAHAQPGNRETFRSQKYSKGFRCGSSRSPRAKAAATTSRSIAHSWGQLFLLAAAR